MATRLYSLAPNATLEDVVEAVGSATTTKAIELTVDLSTSIVNEGSSTRAIKQEEVIFALEIFAQYIIRGKWLPA